MSEAALSDVPEKAPAPGWYGKMPHLGDFVSRRLPESFIAPWDAWLQRGLAEAQVKLGSDWLARYLVAPVYRFWIAPGILDASAWAGVLMPSVDAVGRYFPLTIAAVASTLDATRADDAWFDALEEAARRVLDVDHGPQDLDAALAVVTVRNETFVGNFEQPADGSVWWIGTLPLEADLALYPGLPSDETLAAMLTAE